MVMNKMEIKIIYSKSDEKNKPLMSMPYLGIFALKSPLEKKLDSNVEIKCIDQNLEDTNLRGFGDYACFSINSFNFENSKKLLRKAKLSGSTTIIGGIHPTNVREKMFADENIDYLLVGKADSTLSELIYSLKNNKDLTRISGLIYRDKKTILKNKLPCDFNITNLSIDYNELMKYKVVDPIYGKVLPYISQLGCKGKCFFCSCPDKKPMQKDVKKAWSEIKELCDKYNPDIIRDNTDDFLAEPQWVGEFAKSKPKNLEVPWFGYVRSDKVNQETAYLLKKIGFNNIFLGFESGDNNILRTLNKGLTAETNYNAAKNLTNRGIHVNGTFVLGAPGETKQSLETTLGYTKKLCNLNNIGSISANILIPYMGTKAFQFILKNIKSQDIKLFNNYTYAANIPLKELQREYLKLACPDLSLETLKDYRKKINELSPAKCLSIL